MQLWDASSRHRKATLIISDTDTPRRASDPEMAFSRDGRQLRFWGTDATTWEVDTATRLPAQPIGQPAADQEKFGSPDRPWLNDRKLTEDCRRETVSNNGLWYAAMFLNPSRHFSGEFVKVWRRAALGKPWKSVGTIAATVFNSNLISDLALSHDGKLLVVALNSNTPLQVF
ncbi:MAG TPA: hypothetical protein VF719_00765, partial [Abditibacteriaceae bacterium]